MDDGSDPDSRSMHSRATEPNSISLTCADSTHRNVECLRTIVSAATSIVYLLKEATMPTTMLYALESQTQTATCEFAQRLKLSLFLTGIQLLSVEKWNQFQSQPRPTDRPIERNNCPDKADGLSQ